MRGGKRKKALLDDSLKEEAITPISDFFWIRVSFLNEEEAEKKKLF